MTVSHRLRKWTGIIQGKFPFIYLGCLIYYGRRKISHFENIITKVNKRILSWHNKTLSFRGKHILIESVLQSMHVYLLSAINPPKGVINRLHQLTTRFFWGKTGGIKGKHWVAWEDFCYPKGEGRIGFRSLHDVLKALYSKLWWNFRVSVNLLWGAFLWNKYCKKDNPVMACAKRSSHVWKRILEVRDDMEHLMWWQLKEGSCNFWYYNWKQIGALYFVEEEGPIRSDLEVRNLKVLVGGIMQCLELFY